MSLQKNKNQTKFRFYFLIIYIYDKMQQNLTQNNKEKIMIIVKKTYPWPWQRTKRDQLYNKLMRNKQNQISKFYEKYREPVLNIEQQLAEKRSNLEKLKYLQKHNQTMKFIETEWRNKTKSKSSFFNIKKTRVIGPYGENWNYRLNNNRIKFLKELINNHPNSIWNNWNPEPRFKAGGHGDGSIRLSSSAEKMLTKLKNNKILKNASGKRLTPANIEKNIDNLERELHYFKHGQ